jgi:hypothetical protein
VIESLKRAKDELDTKCCDLEVELKRLEKRSEDKVQTCHCVFDSVQIKYLEEQHSAALKKTKTVITAAEKEKREKWLEEKAKDIKETTIKGLEPEIQKLIAVWLFFDGYLYCKKHKREILQLKEEQEAELKKQRLQQEALAESNQVLFLC